MNILQNKGHHTFLGGGLLATFLSGQEHQASNWVQLSSRSATSQEEGSVDVLRKAAEKNPIGVSPLLSWSPANDNYSKPYAFVLLSRHLAIATPSHKQTMHKELSVNLVRQLSVENLQQARDLVLSIPAEQRPPSNVEGPQVSYFLALVAAAQIRDYIWPDLVKFPVNQ